MSNGTPVFNPEEIAKYSGLFADSSGTPDSLFAGNTLEGVSEGSYDSKYDKGFLPGIDQNEQRASQQSRGERWLNGTARLAGRAVSEVFKMPGSLVGLGGYGLAELGNAFSGEGFGKEDFGKYVNNGWVQYMEENIAEKINDAANVYVPKAVQEGNIWDNLGSASFWATEGADGVGFLLSFLVPGGILAKAGAVGVGANQLGRLGNLSRSLGAGVRTAKNLELGAISSLNALFEASAEAAGGYDNIYESLKLENPEMSEEELRMKAGTAARGIFGANMGILMVPNMIQSSALFGGGFGKGVPEKVHKNLLDPKTKAIATEAAKLSTREKVGTYLKMIGRQSWSEGMLEEGSQFAAEKYYEKDANRSQNVPDLFGIMDTYMENLGSVDMQKGIVLGTLLGSVPGVFQAYKDNKRKDKQIRVAGDFLRNNYSSFSGKLDIYKKKLDSNGVETYELDSNNEPVVDPVKLLRVASTMDEMSDLVALRDASEMAGDEVSRQMFVKDIATKFAMGYMTDPSGVSMKYLDEHMNAIFENNKTPQNDRVLVKNTIDGLRRRYTESRELADNLKLHKVKDIYSEQIDKYRDIYAEKMTEYLMNLDILTEARDSYASRLMGLEQNDPRFVQFSSAVDSFNDTISKIQDRVDTLKNSDPVKLMETFADLEREYTAHVLKVLDQHVETLQTEKAFTQDGSTVAEKPVKGEEGTDLSDLMKQTKKTFASFRSRLAGNETPESVLAAMSEVMEEGEYNSFVDDFTKAEDKKLFLETELDKRINDIEGQQNQQNIEELLTEAAELRKPGLQNLPKNTYNDTFNRLREIAERLKELGFIAEGHKDPQESYSTIISVLDAQLKRLNEKYGMNNRLFQTLSTFFTVEHRTDEKDRLQKKLDDIISKNDFSKDETKKRLKVTVRKNTFPKSASGGNQHLELVSPEHIIEVSFDGERLGFLPEVTKFRFKKGTPYEGMYLVDALDKMTDAEAKLYTGVDNITVAELKQVTHENLKMFNRISEELTKSEEIEVPYSDFDISTTMGKYQINDKTDTGPGTTFADIAATIKSIPGSRVFLFDLEKRRTSTETNIVKSSVQLMGQARGKGSVAINSRSNAEANTVADALIDKTKTKQETKLGRYIVVYSEANGWNAVAIKTPVLTDEQFMDFEKSLRDRSELTKKENIGDNESKAYNDKFNDKVKESVFIVTDQPGLAGSEIRYRVRPDGRITVEFSYRDAQNNIIDTEKDIILSEGVTFIQATNNALAKMKLPEGMNPKVERKYFRQPYGDLIGTVKDIDQLSDMIPSTTSEVRAGRSLQLRYKGKGKISSLSGIHPKPVAKSKTLVEKPSNKGKKGKFEIESEEGYKQVKQDYDKIIENERLEKEGKKTPLNSQMAGMRSKSKEFYKQLLDAYEKEQVDLKQPELPTSSVTDIEKRRQHDLSLIKTIPPNNYLMIQGSAKDLLKKFRDYLTDVLGWDSYPIGYNKPNLVIEINGKDVLVNASIIQMGGGLKGPDVNDLKVLDINIEDVINAKYDIELENLSKSKPSVKPEGPETEPGDLIPKGAENEYLFMDETKDLKERYKSAFAFQNRLKEMSSEELREFSSKNDLKSMKAVSRKVLSDYSFDKDSGDAPFKLTSNNPGQKLDKETVVKRLRAILPGHISVSFVETFAEMFPETHGSILGLYKDSMVYLRETGERGTEYHEAFHSIFRTVFSNAELADIFLEAESKYGRPEPAELLRLKSERNLYGFSMEDLRYVWMEERLADDFQNYMQGRSSMNVFEKFWSRLVEWIESFLGNEQSIDRVFRDISKGKYTNASRVDNLFSENESNIGTTPAYMLIPSSPNSEGKIIRLNSEDSERIVNTIAHYTMYYMENEGIGREEAMDRSISDFSELYDPEDYKLRQQGEPSKETMDRLYMFYDAVSLQMGIDAIKKAVDYRMKLYDVKQDLLEEDALDQEDDFGKNANWDRDASEEGGFIKLSKEIRQYIGFTVYQKPDEFGNDRLMNGIPLVTPVNVNKVYNGVIRAGANQPTERMFIQRLKLFAESNDESGHFINKFFLDVGINKDSDSVLPTKNFHLYQKVVKQLSMFKIDYSSVILDPDKMNVDASKVVPANMNDVDVVQVGQWQRNWTEKTAQQKQEFAINIGSVIDAVRSSKNLPADNDSVIEIEELIEDLHFNMGISGMKVSKGFAKFFVYSAIKDNLELIGMIPEAEDYLTAFSELTEVNLFEDLDEIRKEANAGRSPFAYVETVTDEGTGGEKTEVDTKSGAINRAKRIATVNAVFDETVGSTSWQNDEGKTVYSHQIPTYNLIRLQEYRNSEILKELESDPFLKNNIILQEPEARAIFMAGKSYRLGGIRGIQTDATGKENRFLEQNSGTTFKNMTSREFLLAMLTMTMKNKVASFRGKDGKMIKRTVQPVGIRVLENSSTFDMMDMPKFEGMFNKGSVTDGAVNVMMSRLETERDRIKRVSEEVKQIQDKKNIDIIKGYHTSRDFDTLRNAEDIINVKPDDQNYRGLKLDKMRDLLPEEMYLSMEKSYREGKESSYTRKEIADALKEGMNREFRGFLERLSKEGIIEYSKGEVKNRMIPVSKNTDLVNELGSIFMNDWINSIAINELLLGDEATGLKNSVDAVKRAKGANASGQSIFHNGYRDSGVFSNLPVGILKEPTEQTVFGETDIADAQGYVSIRALRHVMFGLGKLSASAENFLDKIEKGEKITKRDIFGLREQGVEIEQGSAKGRYQLNSLKLVYYDGKSYFKLSVVPLSKELTSYWDSSSNQWKALPGRERLHNMRETMEGYEDPVNPNMNGVSMIVPESASKMMTMNVNSEQSLGAGKGFKFNHSDTRFWRLQLENPSNKTEINDPTQMITLVDSEIDPNDVINYQGEKITVADARNILNSAMGQLRKLGFEGIARTVFKKEDVSKSFEESVRKNKVTPYLKDFLNQAVSTLEASGADPKTIDYFTPDSNGNYRFNLNMPATLNKFRELYLSYFSKGSLKQKMPGYTVALMSGYGMNVLVDSNNNVVRHEDYVERMDEFTFSPEETNKILLTARPLAHNLKTKDGLIYSEMLLPAHFAELLDLKPGDQIPDEVAYMFGVRIPSQDKHSAINLKVVGFLPPYMGSTAIFPHELIKLSGADFDIDKLYIHRFNHYVSGGVFSKYGDYSKVQGDINEHRFSEFINYKMNHDKVFKKKYRSIYNDILEVRKDEIEQIKQVRDQRRAELSEYEDEFDILMEMGEESLLGDVKKNLAELSPLYQEAKENLISLENLLKNEAILETLMFFELPTDVEGYSKVNIELNEGVLQNRILELKMAMYSAESLEVPRNSPATMEAFKSLIKNDPFMQRVFGEESGYVTDNISGKYDAFSANREGARNIGPSVNATLAHNALAKEGASLKQEAMDDLDMVNGFVPEKFSYTNRFGERINDLLSNIVSAMTDNAKELIAKRFGLSFEATGTFAFMTSLGYGFKESILLINQPLVQEYIEQKKRSASTVLTKSEKTEGVYSPSQMIAISKLNKEGRLKDGDGFTEITDDFMESQIDAMRNGDVLSNKGQVAALKLYMTLEEKGRSFSDLNKVIKLVKGTKSDFESIEDVFSAVDNMSRDSFPIEGADRVLANPLYRDNIKILNDLYRLSSNLFMETTQGFRFVFRSLLNNFKNLDNVSADVRKNAKLDLISHFMISAYKNKLEKDGGKNINPLTLSTLSNYLVFPQISELEQENGIIDMYIEAKKSLEKKGIKNEFLDYITPMKVSKSKPYWSLEARTRVKESPQYMEKLENSFEELVDGPDTTAETYLFGIAAINYLIVKDSLQFKNRSFINFIPNRYLQRFSKRGTGALDLAMGLMKDNYMELNDTEKKTYDKKFMDIFNNNVYDFRKNFMQLFAKHPDNKMRFKYINQKVFNEVVKKFPGSMERKEVNGKNVLDLRLDSIKSEKDLLDFARETGFRSRSVKGQTVVQLPYTFKIEKTNYVMMENLKGTKRIDLGPEGIIEGYNLAVRYEILDERGIKGVKNNADLDQRHGGQPLTRDLISGNPVVPKKSPKKQVPDKGSVSNTISLDAGQLGALAAKYKMMNPVISKQLAEKGIKTGPELAELFAKEANDEVISSFEKITAWLMENKLC